MTILEEIENIIYEDLTKSGAGFYSSTTTLVKGDYLLVGLNPGGDPITEKGTIAESLRSACDPMYNEYLADWGKPHRLQKNIIALFKFLKVDLRKVCAFNLFFVRTKRAVDLNFNEFPKYFDVAKKVFETVRPRVVFTFGVKPYVYLLSLLENVDSTFIESGHGKWRIGLSIGDFQGTRVRVIGFPHLSIYTLYNRLEILEAVRKFAIT